MKIVKLWRLARILQRAADRGDVIITVPAWLRPELDSLIWQRKVERAAEKWGRNAASVSVADWGAAASRKMARDMYGDLCSECGIAWDQPSPECPHKIWDLHPLRSASPDVGT